MRITALHLSGFKSFVDPTDLLIGPGTTGIVGPNGCGKSNLVEALRWVMGEGSARRLRGSDMDDVIFAGTTHRPARNLAEVRVTAELDDALPLPYRPVASGIEVARRIGRGGVSAYRINGKSVRARDVHVLFADAGTGAGSASLVSQGQVAALIAARPADRRNVLEDAAGVGGLNARRFEAETRLRAAGDNLLRLDDAMGSLRQRLQALTAQARQAERYRALSAAIRSAQAALYARRWEETELATREARQNFSTADQLVAECLIGTNQAQRQRSDCVAALPGVRLARETALTQLIESRAAVDLAIREERRAADHLAQIEERLAAGRRELGRETSLLTDAGQALERLTAEASALAAEEAGSDCAQAEAERDLRKLEFQRHEAETTFASQVEMMAVAAAHRLALEGALTRADSRLQDAMRRQKQAADHLADATGLLPGPEVLAEALVEVETAVTSAKVARERLRNAAAEHAAMATSATAASTRLSGLAEEEIRLRAEADGLAGVLRATAVNGHTPALDIVQVKGGYEEAVAAALGHELGASLDPAAARHWHNGDGQHQRPAWPQGITPLADYVSAPAAVMMALTHVGVTGQAPASDAAAVGALQPGQTLVTRQGFAWRWDGLVTRPGAEDLAAVRLSQRNRLGVLRIAETAARLGADTARAEAEAASRALAAAQENLKAAQIAVNRADQTVADAHSRATRQADNIAARKITIRGLEETAERLAAELAEAVGERQQLSAQLDSLPGSDTGQAELGNGRAALADLRNQEADARAVRDRLEATAVQRRRRLEVLSTEERAWTTRAEGVRQRIAEILQRLEEDQASFRILARQPDELAQSRGNLAQTLRLMERQSEQAMAALAAVEADMAAVEQQQLRVDAKLSAAREKRAEYGTLVSQTEAILQALVAEIRERMRVEPQQLAAMIGNTAADAGDVTSLEVEFARLVRQREALGPVNLLAVEESRSVTEELAQLDRERMDIAQAIDRLREAINNLNREAHNRLQDAFLLIDRHFQTLFSRLFGGGEAQLRLVDTGNPLDGGLEVYARLPGRKVQTLSLLSGGEQALTALALLFAVFLTRPSPLCVLDEVDAPLDEANVDRVCDLVQELAAGDRTRFLVVTHHRMTMARMDRLYGVTMAERGVSRLVSVDLEQGGQLATSTINNAT